MSSRSHRAGLFVFCGIIGLAGLMPHPLWAETELTFCYDPYPPYTLGQEGSAPEGGLKVDLLAAVTDRIEGVSAKVILMPWKRCQAEAKSGEVDGILPLFRNADRETYLAFTAPTHQEGSAFFYDRRKFPDGLTWTDDFRDLAHLRLGMLNGSFIDTDMEAAFSDGQEITRARDVPTLLTLLMKGRVDLVAIERNVGRHTAQQNGWQDRIAVMDRLISERNSQFGLSKASGADQFLAAFNDAIRDLDAAGDIDMVMGDAQ